MNENPTPQGAAPPPPDSGPGPHPGTGPRVTAAEARDLSRLRRSSTDRHIAGVAGGLGRHLDIDPVILRIAFVVLTLTGGVGLLFYLACWLIVPSDEESATVDLDGRTRNIALWALTIIAGLATLGALLGDPFPWDRFWVPIPLLILALVVWLVLGRNRGRDTAAAGHAPPPTYGAPGYGATGAPGYGDPGWPTAAPATAYLPPPPPRNPRKRGPKLFWPTMALAALGIGVLGVVDLAGVAVADSAYPALVVAACAVMLVVGAFWGRAGGLILVALLATVATAGATAADHWEEGEYHTPATAAAVDDEYRMGVGELVVDLRGVEDLQDLDGRTLELEGGLGRIEVVVPDEGLDVEATGSVGGPGHVVLFGRDAGGIDSRRSGTHDGGDDVPTLTIDASLGIGEIVVRTDSDTRWSSRFDERRNR